MTLPPHNNTFPLFAVVIRVGNNFEIAKISPRNGADINAKLPNGYNTLHSAVGKGDEDIVNLVIADRIEMKTKSSPSAVTLYFR